jgi:hypothetical protein
MLFNRIASTIGVLVTAALMASAAPGTPRAVAISNENVFPHIADGDEWTTSFTLINLSPSPASYVLRFFGDDGNPLVLGIAGVGNTSAVSGVLPVNGSDVLETTGGVGVLQGWARVDTFSTIGGFAVFKSHRPGRAYDFEAAVPVSSPLEHRFMMAFDNTNGFLTGIAVANPSATETAHVSLTFRDTAGNVIVGGGTLTMPPLTHFAFIVTEPDQYPQTAGQRGVVEFSTPTSSLSGLGLRFNPTGPLTSTSPFSNTSW